MGATTIYGIPYVEPGDHPNAFPAAMKAQSEAIEAAMGTTGSPRTARRKSATQALTAAAQWYAVTFDVDAANGTGIAYAGGVFTVPRAGVYQVNAQALMQGPTGAAVRLRVKVNGSGEYGELVNAGTGGNCALVLARAIRLAANETITIEAQSSVTGTSVSGSAAAYTFVDITLIAP